MRSGTAWKFETARFTVRLELRRDFNYRYDGDDENGETQRKLYSGEYIAFDSRVIVELDGEEIASDSLGGSVYGRADYKDFFVDHRCSDPMNRNCTIMRAARGQNVVICHYFPGMVAEAIRQAREHLRSTKPLPYIRANAA